MPKAPDGHRSSIDRWNILKDLTSRETISLRPKGGYGSCVEAPGHLPDGGYKVGGDPKGGHTQVRQAEVQQDHVEVGS